MKLLKGFNSLQTGKHIQRDISADIEFHHDYVSIPFKRESIYKEKRRSTLCRICVSIPFKRESIYKD